MRPCLAASCAAQADNVKQLSQSVKGSLAAFWTQERLHRLCHTLAHHFFTLTVSLSLCLSAGS